ncbi:MAG: asparaginase [Propionibacteriaceae bacterium]|nr:asparaginase [Propionibacteriaceae bacterium]
MVHIALVATGGTIASRSGSTAAGKVASSTAASLVESLGTSRLPKGVSLTAHDAGTMNSYNLTLADARSIGRAIAGVLEDDDVAGVVVTHGTDTLEETAFLHDLTCGDPRPVVFTGAQQSNDTPGGGDGPGNIADAIAVAAHPASRGLGALVVFSGQILPVRGVRKSDTFAAQPFSPVLGGPIGLVGGGMVYFWADPRPWVRLPAPGSGFDQLRIVSVINQPGTPDGGQEIEAALERGADGVVILGSGAGNTSKPLVAGIEAARDAHVPVVLSTRVAHGHIRAVYGNGGAVDAVAQGAVLIWSVPFTQARLLLATLLDRYGPQGVMEHLGTFDRREGLWKPE